MANQQAESPICSSVRFPQFIKKDVTLKSIRQLQILLYEEVKRRSLPEEYTTTYTYRTSEGGVIYVQCKECKSGFSLKPNGRWLIVISASNLHWHDRGLRGSRQTQKTNNNYNRPKRPYRIKDSGVGKKAQKRIQKEQQKLRQVKEENEANERLYQQEVNYDQAVDVQQDQNNAQQFDPIAQFLNMQAPSPFPTSARLQFLQAVRPTWLQPIQEIDQNSEEKVQHAAISISKENERTDPELIQAIDTTRAANELRPSINPQKVSTFRTPVITDFFPNIDTWSALQEWLQVRNYQFFLEWAPRAQGRFPRIIFAISERMRSNYARFGDAVSFDMLYGAISDPAINGQYYQLGLFTVGDTDSRRLLVGFALISNENLETMVTLFRHFITMHGKDPKTIFHSGRETASKALDQLRSDRLLGCNYLTNPNYYLRQCEAELLGPTADKLSFMKNLRSLMKVRNLRIFEKEMQFFKRTNFKDMVEYLLCSSEKSIFYCRTDAGIYTGLESASNLKEIDQFKQRLLGNGQGILRLLDRINILDIQLDGVSKTKFNRYPPIYKVQYDDSDKRLLEIVDTFQQQIVSRFLQNYGVAMRNMRITDGKYEPGTCVIEDVTEGYTKTAMKDWKCQCREAERTGIPCSHLIKLRQTRGGSYSLLFAERWRKRP